jgi:hypothetical protein
MTSERAASWSGISEFTISASTNGWPKSGAKSFSAMIEISSAFRAPSFLSPRTAKYVAALMRDGDNFDYSKWLQRVREEGDQAKQVRAAFNSRDAGNLFSMPSRIQASIRSPLSSKAVKTSTTISANR